jgi:hypothetical protein
MFDYVLMGKPVRDAELAERKARRSGREAAHRYIWIRVAGAWRSGVIVAWFPDGAGWCCWIEHDHPEGRPWPVFAMYVYDRQTIVQRDPWDKREPS